MGLTGLVFVLARRPPVEETTSFLNSLLASHGPNYLEKLFGSKARDRLKELGGVNEVAIALSGTVTGLICMDILRTFLRILQSFTNPTCLWYRYNHSAI